MQNIRCYRRFCTIRAWHRISLASDPFGTKDGRTCPFAIPATVAGQVIAERFSAEFVAYVHCVSLFSVTYGLRPGS